MHITYWVIIGYIFPIVVCYFLWAKTEQKVKVFQALWVFALMFMLNGYGLFYSVIFSKDILPLGLSLDKYLRGSIINLVFVLLWGIGYWIGVIKNIVIYNKKYENQKIKRVGVWSLRVLFIVSGLSTIFFYSMGVSYGETVFDYSSLPVYFGAVASFKQLFLPTTAAYIMLVERIQKKSYGIRSVPVRKLLWIAVGIRVILGLTLDMQRGDVVLPILVALVLLIAKGYLRSRGKILSLMLCASVALIVISPILDILRSPTLYDKEISVKNVISAAEEVAESNQAGLASVSTLLYVPYSKSILPSSTYALSKEVSETGYVYFNTYDDPVLDMIPRFVWPDKPWPLSINGEYSGMAAGVSASNLGKSNIIWVIGGGTMYWQFGWIGVILGGLIVGLIWGQMTQKMLLSLSPFLLIIFFSMFRWGIHYVEGIDQILLSGLRELRALLIIWVPLLIIINAIKSGKS